MRPAKRATLGPLVTALAVLCLVQVAPRARAQAPSADAVWAERLAQASARIRASRARLAASEAAYTEARHEEYPRGDALQALVHERDAARAEHREAKAALPELVEQARRAGASAAVLRPYRRQVEDLAEGSDPPPPDVPRAPGPGVQPGDPEPGRN